jgi:hypothetical protein
MGPDAAIVCQDDIADVLNQARAADAQAKAALQGLAAQAAGFAPAPGDSIAAASATAIPAPGTSPADVRKWWDSLSALQQESLLFTHGAQLGQLDGLPSTVRDRANRAVMAQQKGDLQAEQEQLKALGSNSPTLSRRNSTRSTSSWVPSVRSNSAFITPREENNRRSCSASAPPATAARSSPWAIPTSPPTSRRSYQALEPASAP